VRVVALIASYNEQRFIGPCLEHLHEQGVESYLIDDGSTDRTVEIAERWLGRGLLGIDRLDRSADHAFSLHDQLTRKENLARRLDADWFMHMDPDEVRLAPSSISGETLPQALEAMDNEGFNAVNFFEFTFVPSKESPDHDHQDFRNTLRTYYPFSPRFPNQLKAWKATDAVELSWSSGHKARFPDLRMAPQSFPMKHYLYLSVPHAIEKYVLGRRGRKPGGWRSNLATSHVCLLGESELRIHIPGVELDADEPRVLHHLAEAVGTEF
jgi:Glycosyl transferase family 2